MLGERECKCESGILRRGPMLPDSLGGECWAGWLAIRLTWLSTSRARGSRAATPDLPPYSLSYCEVVVPCIFSNTVETMKMSLAACLARGKRRKKGFAPLASSGDGRCAVRCCPVLSVMIELRAWLLGDVPPATRDCHCLPG